jgi:hypothetical protein
MFPIMYEIPADATTSSLSPDEELRILRAENVSVKAQLVETRKTTAQY